MQLIAGFAIDSIEYQLFDKGFEGVIVSATIGVAQQIDW
jgi:hypothetical protein